MHNPFFSIIAESSDHLFVNDKSGKTVFFPWGSASKQGYYVKNKKLIAKAKKFYKISFYACFALLIISLSIFEKSFWGTVGSMIVCFGGWYLAYFLYISIIVKSLQPAKASYKEIILSKYESEESENEELTEIKFPAQWSKPNHQVVNEPFSGIKRIWSRLSPGQLFMLYFFIGSGIVWIWANLNQHEFGESPIDFLVSCSVCILWGLAGFVVAKNMEIEKSDWWNFLNWKLPMIFIAVVFWSLAIASLYKFFVMIIA
ncbi:MAG: hypothetical protein KPEEDBHJ_03603 [Anaerolineales bacterium]|nr:hypothetical protein [Anaerolineales bacterium]